MAPRRIIVIGASLGGLRALGLLLGALPANLPLPLAVVQHRSPDTRGLAAFLQEDSALPIVEVEDKQPIVAGYVYLAPSDYHLLIEEDQFALSTEAPVLHARPSIDALFQSAADACGPGAVGVVLTGASEDGALGLAAIRRAGGLAIVQNPAEAECAVMPQAALSLAGADMVLSLAAIGPALVDIARSDGRGTLAAQP